MTEKEMSSVGCSKECQREFNALLSSHQVRTKKDYSQPEFFALLLECWKDKWNR